MTSFNLLQEAIITNYSGSRSLTVSEMNNLLMGDLPVVFSGESISILIDLTNQRSIEKLEYFFSPISLSGLTIKYGHYLDNLTTATPDITASGVEVLPTLSGFSYPRYFLLEHAATGTISASYLSVLNTDEEINFGASGIDQTFTIVGSAEPSVSDVKEIKIFNNATNPTDIFVSIDTSLSTSGVSDKLEISLTPTGTFELFDPLLKIPEVVPFEWGLFNSMSVSNSGITLSVSSGVVFNAETLKQIPLTFSRDGNSGRPGYIMSGKNYADRDVFFYQGANHAIEFLDIFQNTLFTSSAPPYSSSSTQRTHPAWDGQDTIYFLRGNNTKEIYKYSISNNSFSLFHTMSGSYQYYANLQTLIYDNALYILGGRNTSGPFEFGGGFYKVDITTSGEELLSSLPNDIQFGRTVQFEDYIYTVNVNNNIIYRYNIPLNSWEQLAAAPNSATRDIFIYNNYLYAVDQNNTGLNFLVRKLNLDSMVWDNTPAINIANVYSSTSTSDRDACLGIQNTVLLFTEISPIGAPPEVNKTFTYAINNPPEAYGNTISGSWISPIFAINDSNTGRQVLFEYEHGRLSADNSVGVDSFEVRGSNTPPSIENTFELFDEPLDTEVFFTQTLNGTIIVNSDKRLLFDHEYTSSSGTPINAGYAYYSFPFSSAGSMHYRFWWLPGSNKTSSTSAFSSFNIVPFIDPTITSPANNRNLNTLRSTLNNYLYVKLGRSTDVGGVYTGISFYNGSSETQYTISAQTGIQYKVDLIIDWDLATYKLYFGGVFLGQGTIPLNFIKTNFEPYHTYEFFSSNTGVTFQEGFKFISITRLGNVDETDSTSIAISPHIEDPLYGLSGTLPWYPISVNSSILPQTKYIQFRLKTEAKTTGLLPKITGIKFPKVFKLENIGPGASGSIYIRYNFPSANSLSTDTITLKAWSAVDKN